MAAATPDYNRSAEILKALGHPDRLRLIEALGAEDGLCVSELMKRLRLDQVAVSKHLAYLKRYGIVESSTAGNYRCYRIAYPCVLSVLQCVSRKRGKG